MARPINVIAKEIADDWENVWFGAVPYLRAMFCLDKVTDPYISETGYHIVTGFLGNARTWRGETARRVKAELREMLK